MALWHKAQHTDLQVTANAPAILPAIGPQAFRKWTSDGLGIFKHGSKGEEPKQALLSGIAPVALDPPQS